MMEKCKTAVRRALRDEAFVMGLVFGVLVFVLIASGMFAAHRLGTVDSGKYERIMRETGLRYTRQEEEADDLLFTRVIEEYDYAHFSFAKLFAPHKSTSLIYPVALIRLLTRPFGLPFSTRYLYLLYAALTGLAVSMIVRSAASLWGRYAAILGAALAILFADRNLTAYFGSLYEVGTLTVALMLFVACTFAALTYRRESGLGAIWPLVLSSAFLLNAGSRAIVFLPMALLALVGLAIRKWERIRRSGGQALAAALVLACAVYSSVGYFQMDPDNTSQAAVYHSVFQGILPATDDPQAALEELGLNESYLEDVGKSYYQDAAAFAHDPRDAQEAERIFSAISTKKVLRWYLAHPTRAARTLLSSMGNMNSLESGWTLGLGDDLSQGGRFTRSASLVNLVGKILLPGGYVFLLRTSCLIVLLCGALWVWRVKFRRDGQRACWLEPALLIVSVVCVSAYLPLHIVLMGVEALEFDRIVSVACLIALWGGLLFAAGRAVGAGSVWFRRIYEEEEAAKGSEAMERAPRMRLAQNGWGKLGGAVASVAGSQRRTVLAVLALAAVMVISVEFAQPRAGMVNNGDFGRMMEHLGLTWTGEMVYNTQAQAGRGVIEEYAFRYDFDPATLTFLKPSYSLVYPTAIVRAACSLLHLRFSTWYLGLVMSAVMLLCVVSIVRDLYASLGRYTLIAGVCLCLIFLCESSLVWFNSLFGEGCILLGVMMLTACCVHLSVAPRGEAIAWVFALAFSGMFLTTAKAQMMVALPVVMGLFIVFALYHRPLRIGRLIAYTLCCMLCLGVIGYKGLRIYTDNNDVSERHTVWQSLFFGALMIADDPIADMQALGIPTEMAADIGKHAFYPDEDYVISPNAPEFDEAVYNHINSVTMVGYYLRHPAKLLYMLNHLARESQEVYSGFRVYKGQDYAAEYDTVDRWGLWLYWRPVFALHSFWGYVLAYGALVAIGAYQLISQKVAPRDKLLVVTFLGIMLIGALQYPLTAIGNGFADNHKQMFGFMICHDMLLALGLPVLLMWQSKGRIPPFSRIVGQVKEALAWDKRASRLKLKQPRDAKRK